MLFESGVTVVQEAGSFTTLVYTNTLQTTNYSSGNFYYIFLLKTVWELGNQLHWEKLFITICYLSLLRIFMILHLWRPLSCSQNSGNK